MIKENRHKYSISAMCKCLSIARSTYYYEACSSKPESKERKLEELVSSIFHNNRNVYGSRKIKKELHKSGKILSRRKISKMMKKMGLVSKYTVAKFKVHKNNCNESNIKNELNRNFNNQPANRVIVSDLTYVRVNNKWNYVCILIDLFNREIVGYSAGINKDAQLIYKAFSKVKTDLRQISMFHTDRGKEFENELIDKMLSTFDIKRSLSNKGCPYDNAVAEATFKLFKTEFIKGRIFQSLEQLKLELADYIHWFNTIRIHSSLNYLSPIDFKSQSLFYLSE